MTKQKPSLAPQKCPGVLDDGTPCDLTRGHKGPHDAMVAVRRLSYDASVLPPAG